MVGAQLSGGTSRVSRLLKEQEYMLSTGQGLQALQWVNKHLQWGLALQHDYAPYQGTIDHRQAPYFKLYYRIKAAPHYLRLPVQIRYNWGHDSTRVRPYAYLALSFGYNINYRNYITERQPLDSITQNPDYQHMLTPASGYSKISVGIMPGAGVSFHIAPKMYLHTEISFYHGLNDMGYNIPQNEYARYEQQLKLQVGILYALK